MGQWSSVGIDGMGTLHIAYVDAIDDRLLYRGVKDRVAIGDPQVIDDGVRSDGLHPVGGSARLFVEQSATAQKLYVYYQDQRDSTLVEASRDLAASAWTHKAIGTDDAGDGFAIAHVVYKDARYLTRFILDRKQTAQFGFVRILALAN